MQDNNGSIDQFFNSVSSPLNAPDKMTGLRFEQQFEIQTSTVRSSNFVGTSNGATAQGTVGTAAYVFVTTQLTPIPITSANFAIPYVTIYEGTSAVGSREIFPQVGSGERTNPPKFLCQAGFDLGVWLGTPSISYYAVSVFNNNAGTTAQIFVQTQWKLIKNTSNR